MDDRHTKGEGGKTVTKRISLVEGLKRDKEELDSATVESFVKLGRAPAAEQTQQEAVTKVHVSPQPADDRRQISPSRKAKSAAVISPGLIPVNVRVRPDLAAALQTASLERQLQGLEPSSKREIIEEALEPWLRTNGYL